MSKSLNLLVKNIERIASGRSLNSVFKDSGIPHSTLSRIMNKQANPSLDTVDKIADCLGVDTFELIKDQKSISTVPLDITNLLENQSEEVYQTIRNLLLIVNSKEQKERESNG